MTVIQRASDMEDLYANNPDPWNNGGRGLYNILMKELVDRMQKYLEHNVTVWCDIGAGGANVLRGIELHQKQYDKELQYSGVDLSAAAVKQLNESGEFGTDFVQMDLEEYVYDPENPPVWNDAAIISWIEVLYYFGDKRPWKESFEEFWKGVRPGSIVIVADSLIPYQYRDYLKKHEEAELLEEYTDYSHEVSIEKRADGKTWTRWLKVRIYRKK
jgi:hypothetical protein